MYCSCSPQELELWHLESLQGLELGKGCMWHQNGQNQGWLGVVQSQIGRGGRKAASGYACRLQLGLGSVPQKGNK